ncbi:DarT1-associated NADAR antitoxin family protein, partial [Staphylococcus simulans]
KLKKMISKGLMISSPCFGRDFMLDSKKLFYNCLYFKSLTQNEKLATEILKYDAFTDIEFNSKRSLNCQSEACSFYVSLVKRGLLNIALENLESF